MQVCAAWDRRVDKMDHHFRESGKVGDAVPPMRVTAWK
jgi:hypothetical protein